MKKSDKSIVIIFVAIVLFLVALFVATSNANAQSYLDTNTEIGRAYRGLKFDLNNLNQQLEKKKQGNIIDLNYFEILTKISYNQSVTLYIEQISYEEERRRK